MKENLIEEIASESKNITIAFRVGESTNEILKMIAIQSDTDISEFLRLLIYKEIYPFVLKQSIIEKKELNDNTKDLIEGIIINDFIKDCRENFIDKTIKELQEYKKTIAKIKQDKKTIIKKYENTYKKTFVY